MTFTLKGTYSLILFISFTFVVSKTEENFTKEHKELLDKIAYLISEKESSNSITTPKPKLTLSPKKEETEVERAERLNKGFERMIQFVNILGQVDNFISDRTKNFVRKLNIMYDDDDNEKSKKKSRSRE